MTRRFIPFDQIWTSPVPVPYSGLVIDGDRAWATGLLPRDHESKVRAPGDTLAQGEILIDYAETLLAAGGLDTSHLSRAVLYLAPIDSATDVQIQERFAEAFGRDTLIETVPVPGFQHPGAMVQLDLFCAPSEPVIIEDLPDGGRARVKRENGLLLMNIKAQVDVLGRTIGDLLSAHKLSPGQLLSGWGIGPEPQLGAIPGQIAPRLPGFFSGALMPSYEMQNRTHLYLTFGTGEVEITETHEDKVRLHLADAGEIAVLDGRYLGGAPVSLDDQTRAVMDGLGAALHASGRGFGDVVKATTFFAGGPSVEELYDNMRIRKSYYPAPGPASSTVPISRMADPGAKVRIEVVLAGKG